MVFKGGMHVHMFVLCRLCLFFKIFFFWFIKNQNFQISTVYFGIFSPNENEKKEKMFWSSIFKINKIPSVVLQFVHSNGIQKGSVKTLIFPLMQTNQTNLKNTWLKLISWCTGKRAQRDEERSKTTFQ